jgi:hypothetical protein
LAEKTFLKFKFAITLTHNQSASLAEKALVNYFFAFICYFLRKIERERERESEKERERERERGREGESEKERESE